MEARVMRAHLSSARVGRLATTSDEGLPHVVPCCFAVIDDVVYIAVDRKPKTTLRLQRVANVEARPAASFLVDHYSDDWRSLWWVGVDGRARIVEDATERSAAISALQAKYAQYRSDPPPGPVIALAISRWRAWSYDDPHPSRSPSPSRSD
jgi:PPOX class probable F420-dependent enzyme